MQAFQVDDHRIASLISLYFVAMSLKKTMREQVTSFQPSFKNSYHLIIECDEAPSLSK